MIDIDNFKKIKPIKQNEAEVSFCKKIKKEEIDLYLISGWSKGRKT